MSKYLFIYKSKNDWTNLPKEQIVQMMDAWGEWIGAMGNSIVQKADPFKPADGKQISSDGVMSAEDMISGFTVIEADNFDHALELAKGSPTLKFGGTIEVYEAFGV